MGDQEGDITQTGNGITPIIGANFSFMQDRLNFVYDKANYTQYEGSGVNTIAYEETCLKSTFTAAIGVDITLGSKK